LNWLSFWGPELVKEAEVKAQGFQVGKVSAFQRPVPRLVDRDVIGIRAVDTAHADAVDNLDRAQLLGIFPALRDLMLLEVPNYPEYGVTALVAPALEFGTHDEKVEGNEGKGINLAGAVARTADLVFIANQPASVAGTAV
jgi:hypothetical protein